MLKISIIGSGVVGQASGKGFAEKDNFDVVFVDVNDQTISQLKKEGYQAIRPEYINKDTADVFFLSVPTPTINKCIKLDYLIQATVNLAEKVLSTTNKRHTIVVRSTVPPGTTEKLVLPLLEKHSGKKAGLDFGVSMNPEYLREESAAQDFSNPRLITIGALDDASAATLEEIYKPFNMKINRLSLAEAETQKYVHNIFNATKIAFFNEMRIICNEADINAEKIFPLVAKSSEGCWSPEYGTKNKGPFSGSCLPKDTAAFLDWAKNNLTTPMKLLSAVIEVNDDLKLSLSQKEQATLAEKKIAQVAL